MEEKSEKRWTLYVHINKTNFKKYVGITSQKPEYRWNYGRAYKQCPHFNSAIQKYGWDGFEHIVIFDNLLEEEAKSEEKRLISLWQTQDNRFGYNYTSGGDSLSGYKQTPEVIRRIAESHIGTKRSEETKRKMSENTSLRRPDIMRKSAEAKFKPVIATTLDGDFVGRFESITSAALSLGLNDNDRRHISDCCKGNRKTCRGYKWKYA